MAEEIRNFGSKIVDLRSISDESAARIAALLQAKRERATKEAASSRVELKTLSTQLEDAKSEEMTGRESICKEELKYFDMIQRKAQETFTDARVSFEKYQKLKHLQEDRDKKVRKLQKSLLRESFWNFMKLQREQGVLKDKNAQPLASSLDIDDATRVLQAVYEPCIPPFATDPQECWARGVTIPPAMQKPLYIISPDKRWTDTIPSYHEFAESVRSKCQRNADADAWWLQKRESASPSRNIEYRSTPLATYATNFPFHAEPE